MPNQLSIQFLKVSRNIVKESLNGLIVSEALLYGEYNMV